MCLEMYSFLEIIQYNLDSGEERQLEKRASLKCVTYGQLRRKDKVWADSMIEFLADHFANSLMSDLSKGPQVSGY